MTAPANMSPEQIRDAIAELKPNEREAFANYIQALKEERGRDFDFRRAEQARDAAERQYDQARKKLAQACEKLDEVLEAGRLPRCGHVGPGHLCDDCNGPKEGRAP